MTCKDCIYYEVCADFRRNICEADKKRFEEYRLNSDGLCCNFKDKSRFVELPCKVGDTVHAFCVDFGVVLPYFIGNLSIGFMDKERNYFSYEANCHAEETDELLDEIDFDLDDIGKTVFLTRWEAEKALEGQT